MTTPRPAVTLDVGGSHVTAGLVDLSVRSLLGPVARLDVPHTAPQDVQLDAWVQVVREVLAGHDLPPGHLGIAVPSPFDHDLAVSGMTHKFAALSGVPLRPELSRRLRGTLLDGAPIRFGNDADLYALGEWWAGAGRGAGRVMGITLGTGLGAGFIDHGRIVTHGSEVPPGGELWNTPFRGDIAETFACGAALSRLAQTHLGEALTGRQLSARVIPGLDDPGVGTVFSAFGTQLAQVLGPWATRFQATKVVLGGNVSRAFPHFAPTLQRDLPPGVQAVQSEHFEMAALLGAALLGVAHTDSDSILLDGE